ncbi:MULTISPECIES: FMN-binding glutamate synthase family protein [Nitrosomonas]|uniref:Glutamate synthase n=1 Tax=Nitrosomonas communis TaxID=44574 RepID=A0A0F7KFX1_9PROT|nr:MULTISPECIES: FMN-binding glutamate synthase family protein [Nitrosomonas]AKH38073.1 glutamate synthase [Nitrosomonas communis]TYP88163.1 glutamate synthase domain-containing protein 2 [Nitrosomonas communis]UVS59972.1 FMN-binding glutamate synthase family protein [Nitrosomonas sp. PLL12]SDW91870.1 Glutamate synthase domain-containing protein 2 [Nitrosomonas communis]
MSNVINPIVYSIGTILGLVFIGAIVALFIHDIIQKQHSILRNYPVIGRLRFLFELQGKYFRQYWFAGDREEQPFDRATRAWVYKNAKNKGGIIGFGSTYDLREPGASIFVNAAFPIQEEDQLPTPSLLIGEGYCQHPFEAKSIINISGMSYGAISAAAIRALSLGAAKAGCWLNTGEGGLSPYHKEGGCDVIMQIGTAKYGVRDENGNFSPARAKEIAQFVKAFEIKLSQGAKPGKGGLLLAPKVTPEVAAIRGIPVFQDSISPNRHHDIGSIEELLDKIAYIRDLTGRPVGVKSVIGGWHFINELCDAIHRRGLEYAPDFLTIDGGEGGSGAAPQTLMDYAGLPIAEALPRVVDTLIESDLKKRIRVIAAGKLVTSAHGAWALSVGADFVNTARGFMFALGCIQALRCHLNTCPTGITTHDPWLQRGLVVEQKYLRVANYAINVNKEIAMLAHSCGLKHAREFRREHVRIVQTPGKSVALNMLYPYPEVKR